MASKTAALPLTERADIHKSCKALETLLNVLNDYCEAAGATVILQKKLAKALRDTAGMKATGEIAANAMNASATLFDVSSDIGSKFAKIADKEYDAISAEVKKWFKKLAKEERTHDERMANANARIKQAGQVYEKKSKKNPRDATEEHARYINLITALGPEISQEKYNHALSVAQRHASTTYSAAACLSRVADAEWLRTCEGVRRFSPTIGQLGEWRALCEGGWSGSIPQDLPDLNESQQPQPDREVFHEKRPEEEDLQAPTTLRNVEARDSREWTEQARAPPGYSSGAEAETPREPPITRHSPTSTRTNPHSSSNSTQRTASNAPSAYEPPRPFVDKNNSDSVRSLSVFPLPPTHFPIPPPRQQQPSQSQSSQSSSYANLTRLTESPLPASVEDGDDQPAAAMSSPQNVSSSTTPPSPEQRFQEKHNILEASNMSSPVNVMEESKIRQPMPIRSHTSLPSVASYGRDAETSIPAELISEPTKPDFIDTDREFGVNVGYVSKSRTAEAMKPSIVERIDTGGSSGSIVAAMRNRYSNTSGTTSPSPKDVPRLPLSVNDLASRYQPMEGPSSPRLRTPSLSARQLPVPPINTDSQARHNVPARNAHAVPSSPSSPRQDDAVHRRQQQLNDLAQMELKEKERQLLERERDIEKRARELERDRARLHDVHEGDEHGNVSELPRDSTTPQPYSQIRPRERKTSFRNQRPQSQLDIANNPASASTQSLVRPHSQYSYSTSHLVPPSPSSNNLTQPSRSQNGEQSQSSSFHSQYSHSPSSSHQSPQSAHAPYCGCVTCSAAKYRAPQTAPAPSDLRPPAEPISLRPPEKSKPGWIRRLSMPVGGAFGLDSKKGTGNFAGVGSGQGRSGIFSMDGKKNASNTALRMQEDGRRSYEASGISNRSMTNLGAGRR
ncbi:hypothetical protein D9615_004375 [Tricholomella constricta]|uniref:Uncharacterized protein n=1 Tax=Tricholomella constricta TaxID=117010 RepID=A0A8H5M641_9AGAR|nr:hypothetical protein D9615_004375 [Tricholomella constricta]